MWLHVTTGNMDPGGHGNAWQTDGQRTRLRGVMGRPGPVLAGLIEMADRFMVCPVAS